MVPDTCPLVFPFSFGQITCHLCILTFYLTLLFAPPVYFDFITQQQFIIIIFSIMLASRSINAFCCIDTLQIKKTSRNQIHRILSSQLCMLMLVLQSLITFPSLEKSLQEKRRSQCIGEFRFFFSTLLTGSEHTPPSINLYLLGRSIIKFYVKYQYKLKSF